MAFSEPVRADVDHHVAQVLDVAELEGATFEPLTAKCEKCGQTAVYTQRTVSAREQCLVGGSEAYAAVCEQHHTVNPPSQ